MNKMLNKRLGIVISVVSVLIGIIIFYIISKLGTMGRELGCYPSTAECLRVENFFSVSHIAMGVIAFLFSLGIYLIFFSKGEEAIIERLEDSKNKSIKDERFSILLKGLDEYEKRILKLVREQQGITQSSLGLKAELSKAKISQVVSELERKKLIKRVNKKKSYMLYFLENF